MMISRSFKSVPRLLQGRYNLVGALTPAIQGYRYAQTTPDATSESLSNQKDPVKNDDNSSDHGAVQEKKQPETALGTELKVPDENPDVPKTLVFQQLTKIQGPNDPIYTMEEAALYTPKDTYNIYFKYPTLTQKHKELVYASRGVDNEYTMINHFPDVTDYCVVGSGLIGSACAYYLKKVGSRLADVLVLDKDPYSSHNCTALCNGLISTQSKSQDISRIAYLSKELIRNLKNDVLVTPEDFAKIKYRPCTHLILWPENEVEEVLQSVSQQNQDGIFTEARTPVELEQTFPWLRAQETDIALGTYGNQDDALVDPIALRNLYRTLAQAHGANFMCAEAIDFNTMHSIQAAEILPNSATAIVARIPKTGELKSLGFASIILALGHNTPYLEARSELESYIRDSLEDLHFIQPALRVCFQFHSFNTPLINFPVVTDTDGSVLIRDDYCGTFKYYIPLDESESSFGLEDECHINPDSDEPYPNLIHRSEMFEKYFNDVIKPKLSRRIPAMEDAKFGLAYSGFESRNTHDDNPIIGIHPYHSKVLLSGGYGSRLMNYGPAAAIALTDLVYADEEELFDMTNFYWTRVMKGRRLQEFKSLVS